MTGTRTQAAHRVDIPLPEMGESVTEGEVTTWLVAVGDTVEVDQPLVEISTDKVDAEVPSPVAGTVTEIRFGVGDVVEVDSVLAVIETTDEVPLPVGHTSPGSDSPQPVAARVTPTPTAVDAEPRPAKTALRRAEGTRVLATPVARKIAAGTGLDLSTLTGSGARGRITRADVEDALADTSTSGPGGPDGPSPIPPSPSPPPPTRTGALYSVSPWAAGESVRLEPMSRIRRLTAEHMSYSQASAVHVTTVFEADWTRVAEVRRRHRDAFEREHSTKLTFMPFLFAAVSRALRSHPKFNAAVSGDDIVYKNDVNLGMAVATDRGLLVPVIRQADRLGLADLGKTANDLAERARGKKIRPDELTRGTFTITNPGVYGSLFGTPIINQPQVAILCVGTIEKRVTVVETASGDDALAIRTLGYLALTYDHRLIDGADAEVFMADVGSTLADDDWSELDA